MDAATTDVVVREFDAQTDTKSLRQCAIELQDAERVHDPRLPKGADIIDGFLPQLFGLCRSMDGKVLVADADGTVVGYIAVFCNVQSEGLQDGEVTYGLVEDLIVRRSHRRLGIGKKLLLAAERLVKSRQVKFLRIGLLAQNELAADFYSSIGYTRLYIEMEKDLS